MFFRTEVVGDLVLWQYAIRRPNPLPFCHNTKLAGGYNPGKSFVLEEESSIQTIYNKGWTGYRGHKEYRLYGSGYTPKHRMYTI